MSRRTFGPRSLSVGQIVRDEIANIQTYGEFNAFVTTFDFDSEIISKNVKRASTQFEERSKRKDGTAPALLGIPFTVKDNVFVTGYRTTAGCVAFKDFVPNVNGDVYRFVLFKGSDTARQDKSSRASLRSDLLCLLFRTRS